MVDRYASFARTGAGYTLIKRLGLPAPPKLRRYEPGDPLDGPVTVAGEGRFAAVLRGWFPPPSPPEAVAYAPETDKLRGIIVDATGLAKVGDLRDLYDILHPVAR